MEEKTIPVMASLSFVNGACFGQLVISGVLPDACEEHKYKTIAKDVVDLKL